MAAGFFQKPKLTSNFSLAMKKKNQTHPNLRDSTKHLAGTHPNSRGHEVIKYNKEQRDSRFHEDTPIPHGEDMKTGRPMVS